MIKVSVYCSENYNMIYVNGSLWHYSNEPLKSEDFDKLHEEYPDEWNLQSFALKTQYESYGILKASDILNENDLYVGSWEPVGSY